MNQVISNLCRKTRDLDYSIGFNDGIVHDMTMKTLLHCKIEWLLEQDILILQVITLTIHIILYVL